MRRFSIAGIACTVGLVSILDGSPIKAQQATDNGNVIWDDGYEYDTAGTTPTKLPLGNLQVLTSGTSTTTAYRPASGGPGTPRAGSDNYYYVRRP